MPLDVTVGAGPVAVEGGFTAFVVATVDVVSDSARILRRGVVAFVVGGLLL